MQIIGSVASLHKDQLTDHQYRNWVKSGLGLKYFKEGVEVFVDTCVQQQQTDLLQGICNDIRLSSAQCGQCTLQNLLPHTSRSCGRGRICHCYYQQSRRECPERICGKLYERLVLQHRYGSPSWHNTDFSKWCTDHWQIAKCFLDKKGYKDKGCATETDCKGLLDIIINNQFIHGHIDEPIDPPNDTFSKNKQARNEILHSGSLRLPDAEMEDYLDDLIKALMDKKQLKHDTHAKLAVRKLNFLKSDKFIISNRDEIEIRESALAIIEDAKNDALSALEDKQSKLLSDMDIASLRTGAHGLNQSMSTLKERQDKLEERTSKLGVFEDKIKSLEEASVPSLELRLTTVETRQNSIEQVQTETSNKLQSLQTEIACLTRKVDKEDALKSLLEHNMSYLKRKRDLQSLLVQLYGDHLSTVPISPVLQADVSELYVDLIINNDLVNEPRADNVDMPGDVNGYADIIFKEGKRCKNIYVTGDAWMGKTTWCLKVLRTWVSALKSTNNPGMDQADMAEDETFLLAQFDLVLYVALRHAERDGTICDMISHQLFDEYPEMFGVAQEVIKHESERVLIICDGLDEWSPPAHFMPDSHLQNRSIPSRKNLYGSTVITTTQPWKLDNVRLNEKSIDRCVNLEGIRGQEQADSLVGFVLNHLNTKIKHIPTHDRHLPAFKNDVLKVFPNNRRSLDFPPVFRVPLILVFVVCQWHETGTLERTLVQNYCGILDFLFKHAERAGFDGSKGKLSAVTNLTELKQLWTGKLEEVNFPDCVKEKAKLLQYGKLIEKLSAIAFNALCRTTKSQLVFTQETLSNILTNDELMVCIKVGILTQSKVICKSLTKTSSLSFLHKSFQEFFVALYIAQLKSVALDKFKHSLQSDNDVGEMETVIRMVCAMDCSISRSITYHIALIINKTISMNKYTRPKCLQTLINCVKEIDLDNNEAMSKCPVYSNVLYHSWLSDQLATSLILLHMNKRHLQIIDMTLSDVRDLQIHKNIAMNLKYSSYLEILKLDNVLISDENTIVFSQVFRNLHRLKELILRNVYTDMSKPLRMAVCLDLRACTCLEHLQCSNSNAITTIMVDSVMLRKLHLSNIKLDRQMHDRQPTALSSDTISSKHYVSKVYVSVKIVKDIDISVTDCNNCTLCIYTRKGIKSRINKLVCKRLSDSMIDICQGVTAKLFHIKNCDSCYIGNFNIQRYINLESVSCKGVEGQALRPTGVRSVSFDFKYLIGLSFGLHHVRSLIEKVRYAQCLNIVQLYGAKPSKQSGKYMQEFLSVLADQKHLKQLSFEIEDISPECLKKLTSTVTQMVNLETLDIAVRTDTLFAWPFDQCTACSSGSVRPDMQSNCFGAGTTWCKVEENFKSRCYHKYQYKLVDSISTLPKLVSLGCNYLPTHTFKQFGNLQVLICRGWTHIEYKGLRESLTGLKHLTVLEIVDVNQNMCPSLLQNLFELRNLKRYVHGGLDIDHGHILSESLPKMKYVETLRFSGMTADWEDFTSLNLSKVKTLREITICDPKVAENTWRLFEGNLPTTRRTLTVKLEKTSPLTYEHGLNALKNSSRFVYQKWNANGVNTFDITLSNTEHTEL